MASRSSNAAPRVRIAKNGLMPVQPWCQRQLIGANWRPTPTLNLLIEGLLAPIHLRVLLPDGSVTRRFLEQLIELLLNGVRQRASSEAKAEPATCSTTEPRSPPMRDQVILQTGSGEQEPGAWRRNA